MPARFARLRIAGFKSFADAAAIEILPGLTGIVGPNGCGKSNVVDALRWAMGEASAKTMRGGEMDDVIFAGCLSRPARSVAEVTISLTDTAGEASSPFNAEAELQISRKIERGVGSTYRVNGREARARDVATLFADLASGARNSGLISQGRVSALVMARPDERRTLLEEAAGITGLHSRRHEADLKLRAAEQNLTRAEDLRLQQDGRLAELRKQARQALRYRNLSGAIREAEADYLSTERHIAEASQQVAQAELTASKAVVAAAQSARDIAIAAERDQGDTLPVRRSRESETRAALERARLQFAQIEAEIVRTQTRRGEIETLLATLVRDHQHAERIAADADAAKSRLLDEATRLAADHSDAPMRIAATAETARRSGVALNHAEATAQLATEAAAQHTANRQSVATRLNLAQDRARQAGERASRAISDHERSIAALVPQDRIADLDVECTNAEAERRAAETAQTQLRDVVLLAEFAYEQAKAHSAAALSEAQAAQAAMAGLQVEADALAALLSRQFGREPDPVLDQIKVPEGLEIALGAALRDELAASTRPEAARRWRALPAMSQVHHLSSLAAHIEAPAALHRALEAVLLLPEHADGDDLQGALAPGQILVSNEGAVWRWDGFTARAGAPSEAGIRLAQRNRLGVLQVGLTTAQASATQAANRLDLAEAGERAARQADELARAERKAAEGRADRSRTAAVGLLEAVARLTTHAERQALTEANAAELRTRLEAEAAEAVNGLSHVQAALIELGDAQIVMLARDQARSALIEARQTDASARQAVQQEIASADQRERRLTLIDRELAEWSERARDSASRVTDLAVRVRETKEALAAVPTDAHAHELRDEAKTAIDRAQAEQQSAARCLAEAERQSRLVTTAARHAEQKFSDARETLLGAESNLREANFVWGAVAERILQRLGASPSLPVQSDPTPASAERARRRFERLTRERDEIGAVNLRAEIEVAEIEERLLTIERERDEITSAIAKLRDSIGRLNREGRERLSSVFTEIDRHFQTLFTRMFGGGRAHLALTGSDDPLAAGLEIFAEPPGKKLATLSLLSGGEQALTALSLIFAVFRCNPAPISVLDEVDAPLDDANVERFCTLLDDMARETGTRFLVVTHHHLTMARMDRLYGVTMQERGISRILSVDLGAATAMVARTEAMAAE